MIFLQTCSWISPRNKFFKIGEVVVALLLADPDPSIVNPGTVGSLVVLGLFIAIYFVLRGLFKHLRKLPKDEV